MRERNQRNKEANLSDIKSHLSLTTHNMDESGSYIFAKKKTNRGGKKTLNDFEIVRGLGKGAFGRVFMIKERENEEPIPYENSIMSIRVEEEVDENEQVENM